MNAYEKGRAESGTRKEWARKYQTDKAEREYWRGYIDVMKAKLVYGEQLVQCEREGTIFVAKQNATEIDCPTCGRRYTLLSNGEYCSDRKLTIISV